MKIKNLKLSKSLLDNEDMLKIRGGEDNLQAKRDRIRYSNGNKTRIIHPKQA